MMKATCLGLTVCFAMVPPTVAQIISTEVQPPPFVTDICPNATWTEGYRIGEMIPLSPSQYHSAVVINATPLRSGYGFAGNVITDLQVGAQVTITGEAWDMGYNQWIAVAGDQQISFVHGNDLLNF